MLVGTSGVLWCLIYLGCPAEVHMPPRISIHDQGRSSRVDQMSRNGLLQLGWPHFWLFSSILAGILAIAIVVIFAHLSSL